MSDIKEYIDSIDLDMDVVHRTDCPECGGGNTFTVTKTLDGTVWNCYSATCSVVGGTSDVRLSSEELEMFLQRGDVRTPSLFQIPDIWVPARQSKKTMDYLKVNNCLDAYEEDRADIMYDPVLDRHVFVSWSEGICKGAVGRLAGGSSAPKWWVYSLANTHPLVIPQYGVAGFPEYPNPKVGVLVEDAASACAVSCEADGIALMGTNLNPYYVPVIKEYDSIIIALDPDAHNKGIDMQLEVSMYTNAKVATITDDLKYMQPDQIRWEIGDLV
jgi:hypothetical protein